MSPCHRTIVVSYRSFVMPKVGYSTYCPRQHAPQENLLFGEFWCMGERTNEGWGKNLNIKSFGKGIKGVFMIFGGQP